MRRQDSSDACARVPVIQADRHAIGVALFALGRGDSKTVPPPRAEGRFFTIQ